MTARPDLKGKTIEINGKRYLVASCTFRQPSARDAAGWAMLLINERGELDQHMVGIDGPIKLIDGPRPIAAGSFGDLVHRTETRKILTEGAAEHAAKGIAFAQSLIPPAVNIVRDDARATATHRIDGPTGPQVCAAPALVESMRGRAGTGTSDLPGPQQPREISWAEAGNARVFDPIGDAIAKNGGLTGTPLRAAPDAKRDEFTIRGGERGEINERVAMRLSPHLAAAIAEAPKVVQNAPLEVDRNRFLGSVPIGKDDRCVCRTTDTCPMDRSGMRCHAVELTAAGHNWHFDKPGTDDGATVGTAEIPAITDERVPDRRVLELWENAHAGHNAIAHPVELQALCEEVNSHRRASTAHHNSRHMQALRDRIAEGQKRIDRLELQVVEARNSAKTAERESIQHREARSTAEHRATSLGEELAASRALVRQAVSDVAAARNEIGNLQRARDSADEQVRIMSEALGAANAENATLVEKVDRLEHEIALVTKFPTVMPGMPWGTYESEGVLFKRIDDEHAVVVAADDHVLRNAWARRLVAERNHAREVAIALDRRIAAMTRTMSPVASGPQQGDAHDAAGNPVTLTTNGTDLARS